MGELLELEDRLRALMLASLAGDAASYRRLLTDLTELLRRYFQRRLYDNLSSQADDLVQETLLAIHARRMTYNPDQALTPWVYAIARYKLVDLLRRSRQDRHLPIDDVADFIADETSPAQSAGDRHDLDTMLDTLPERTRALIRRVKIDGQSVAEVAASTGMSESAVKVAVHRGFKALLARFGGKQ
ncbi:MAG: sigma-70 family RNA polymerase sigma factor [Hyphomicrobiaceae bacterium]